MTCELFCGALFLHIPKTGGSWVFQALDQMGLVRGPIGRQPHTAYEHAVLFPQEKRRWKEWARAENWRPDNWLRPGRQMKMPYTFCFVRHPVRWYESWWRYLRGKNGIPWLETAINDDRLLKRWSPLSVPSQAFCNDFNQFVARMHAQFPGYVTWLYGMYAVPEVNFVGRQEYLADGLIHVLTHLGLSFDETRVRERPHVNEAGIQNDLIRWDNGLLHEVQAAEATIMARYAYPTLTTDSLKIRLAV